MAFQKPSNSILKNSQDPLFLGLFYCAFFLHVNIGRKTYFLLSLSPIGGGGRVVGTAPLLCFIFCFCFCYCQCWCIGRKTSFLLFLFSMPYHMVLNTLFFKFPSTNFTFHLLSIGEGSRVVGRAPPLCLLFFLWFLYCLCLCIGRKTSFLRYTM